MIKLTLKFLKFPEDDPHRRKPDISLAKNILNWGPSITFEEGLDRTVSFFKKLL